MWKHLTVSRKYDLIPEIVWNPRGTYLYPDAKTGLAPAYARGELVPAPNYPEIFGFKLASGLGGHADPNLQQYFKGAKPETIGLMMVIGYLTRQHSGRWNEALTISSLVRSQAYQEKLNSTDHSIHCTGWSIDFSRACYESDAQRAGFQYALTTLDDRGDICQTVEIKNNAVHVTLNRKRAAVYRAIYQEGMAYLASL